MRKKKLPERPVSVVPIRPVEELGPPIRRRRVECKLCEASSVRRCWVCRSPACMAHLRALPVGGRYRWMCSRCADKEPTAALAVGQAGLWEVSPHAG